MDPEGTIASKSTAPNSTSLSEVEVEVDDDSVTDKHYNPAEDAAILDYDESEDMHVDDEDEKEVSPRVKSVRCFLRDSRATLRKSTQFGTTTRRSS